MRKKLDTRFPANACLLSARTSVSCQSSWSSLALTHIKKIMQADEDVGKIALAVPVLVSKALELFLKDLCDRAYEITLQRAMNSLHLLQRNPLSLHLEVKWLCETLKGKALAWNATNYLVWKE